MDTPNRESEMADDSPDVPEQLVEQPMEDLEDRTETDQLEATEQRLELVHLEQESETNESTTPVFSASEKMTARERKKVQKELRAEKMRTKRLDESQEEREKRLEDCAERAADWRSNGTRRQSESRKRGTAARMCAIRSEMTEDEKKKARELHSSKIASRKSSVAPEEKKQYQRMKKAESRARRSVSTEQDSPVVPSPTVSETSRKRRSDTAEVVTKKSRNDELPDMKHNVKVRFGWVDVFNLETQAIVIPYYENDTSEGSLESQFTNQLPTINERNEHEEKVRSDEWKDKMASYQPVHTENSDALHYFLHVRAPVCEKGRFTIVSEADLRATYFSILYYCDSSSIRSVGIPLLGKGVFRKKSLAIAFQSVFTYFKTKTSTNLELVYLVTSDADEYDDVVAYTSFVREFDLSIWSRGSFEKLETFLYDQYKNTKSYSTFPGTDGVLRVFKSSKTRNKAKEEDAQVLEIHRKMCALTKVEFEKPTLIKKKDESSMKRPRSWIAESYDTSLSVVLPLNFYSFFAFTPSLSRLCGSYAALRRIWIVSRFFLYFSGNGDNFDPNDSCARMHRKRLCSHLKPLHRALLREWVRIRKYAPHKCCCTMEIGIHEGMTPFITQMSHYDGIYEPLVHPTRCNAFAYNGDAIETFDRWIPRKYNDLGVVNVFEKHPLPPGAIEDVINEWFATREDRLITLSENIHGIVEKLDLTDFRTAYETIPLDDRLLDTLQKLQLKLDDPKDPTTPVSRFWLEFSAARDELSQSEQLGAGDVEEKRATLQKARQSLRLRHWKTENTYVEEIEMEIRNRSYRKLSIEQEGTEECWVDQNDNPVSIDEFMVRRREYLHVDVDTTPIPSEDEDEESEERQKYPDAVDLGDRVKECTYCHALTFQSDTNQVCCKKGMVFIEPTKKLPPCINELLRKPNKNLLIAANAAFSMASIHYTRVSQAAGGVQSMKVKGLISFHPSALKAHNTSQPRYANFVVLDKTNEEIAALRMDAIYVKKPSLKPVFEDIQKYLMDNNALVDVYKNMMTLEEEARNEGYDEESIRFRIVPPHEHEQVELLQAHKGVYAKPSRMGEGYISVAYSMDTTSGIPLPRGLTVYPKNPVGRYQEPLSVFSETVDPLCYTLLNPDGQPGWGLHRYRRWTGKKSQIPSFETRKSAHIRELREHGEDPDQYWNNVPDERQEDEDDQIMDVDAVEAPISESEDEEDPNDLSDDAILDLAVQEDLQDAPLDLTVGKMKNIRMEERLGQYYPVLDAEEPLIDIPLLGDPFGMESDDEEEPPVIDRYADGTDVYEYFDGTSTDEDSKVAGQDVPEERVQVEEEEGAQEDDGDEQQDLHYGFDQVLANEAMEVGDDLAMMLDNGDPVANDDQMEVEQGGELDEMVHFGDEHAAEHTALARKNDGIHNIGQRQFVSIAEYATFVLQDRHDMPCKFQGKALNIGQLLTIDWCCRMIEMRMKAIQDKRAEFARAASRSTIFKFFEKMVEEKVDGTQSLGMLVTMPSTVPGTSKYQKELIMSAITISNELGHPDLFITFTGNPKWPEIQRECLKQKCEWSDIPQFVNSVFWRKAQLFFEIVLGEKIRNRKANGRTDRKSGIFGKIRWFNFSVEFQQRGMPHIHLLISLEEHITQPHQIDRIVSAEVPRKPTDPQEPDFEKKLRYWQLVRTMMTHTPCQGVADAYCNEGKKPNWSRCTKDFPKKLTENTIISDSDYPDYRRTSRHVFEYVRKDAPSYTAGSEYVVAHNMELLMLFECHINVEVVSSIKIFKYVFKYIHKGADRVLLEAMEKMGRGRTGNIVGGSDAMTLQGNIIAPRDVNKAVLQKRQKEVNYMMRAAGVDTEHKIALNDCHYMTDLSAMTANEATWKLCGLPMHGSSHIVHRGFVHEHNNELILFHRGLDAAKAGRCATTGARSMMIAWFEANQHPVQLPDGRMTTDLTFPEMLKYFKFSRKEQKFVLRKYDYSHRIFARIQAPEPRYLELTATRHLAEHRAGVTSFEELKTVDGIVYDTCLEAARALRLMDGESEWDAAIKEVGQYHNPVECRRVFASILLHCAPANPEDLFFNNLIHLLTMHRRWSEEQRVAHALRHINFLLDAHGMHLNDFQLEKLFHEEDVPESIDDRDDTDNPLKESMPVNEHQKEGEQRFAQLNASQLAFVERALELADSSTNTAKIMFLDGPGGTGKTFCYKTVYHLLKAKGMNVTCVAHTGIAACLLPSGCTAHRMFSIPLEVSDELTCRVVKGSVEGDRIRKTDVVFWDEASMTDRRIYEAVDRLFRDMKDVHDVPFGGTLFILGGDWRQILPIVEGVRGPGVVDFTLKRSVLWNHVEQFKLTVNQRAVSDPEFAATILSVGDGRNYHNQKRQLIKLDEELLERGGESQLIDWVFPDVNDLTLATSAAILTTDNRTALRLNDAILDKLDGNSKEFLSVDKADTQTGLNVDPAVFASQTPQGMPPHKLRLKVGAQVVLLRNISVQQSLCNGTRLTITKIGQDILECVNNLNGRTVFLHRQVMTPSGSRCGGFRRKQFPIRLAYACTINKAQGQTLTKVGLLLTSDVFTHGQLYVAVSRVRNAASFRLSHYKRKNWNDDHCPMGGMLVRNVVYADAFALSQCSKKQLENVKARAKVFDDPLYLSVTIDSTCEVMLDDYERPGQKISWNFYHPGNIQMADLENPKSFKVNEEDMDFYQMYHPCHFGTSSTITPLNLLKFAEHVTELFDGAICDDMVLKVKSGFPVLEVLEAIRSIPLFLNTARMRVYQGRVTHEEMRQLLDSFHNYLHIYCQPDEGFVYEKPVTADTLHSSGCWWNRETLLKQDCRRLTLYSCMSLKSEDLNAFFHNWMNGDNQKIQKARISIEKEDCTGDSPPLMTKLLKGLPAIPGSLKGPEADNQYWSDPRTRFEDGMDLKRESDGAVATVVVSDRGSTEVLFVVWQEPLPDNN